jgi:copper resistance protein D
MNMSGMDMAPEWLTAVLAWPAILATTLMFGSAMLCIVLRLSAADRTSSSDTPSSNTLARTLNRWWRGFAVVAAIFSSLMFLDQVAEMAGVSWHAAMPLLGEVLQQTQGGHIWEWRLPVTLALLIAAWIPMRDSVRMFVLWILCAALFLAGSLMSHAIDFGATAIVFRFVHTLAAGAWAGGLFGYWVGARPAGAESHLSIKAGLVLSRVATWSVLILIASGIYLAYEGLGGSLYHLRYSSYGRVLSIKVAVFALVLAVGAYNRFSLIPTIDKPSARRTLLRTVAAESLMLVGVLGLAALLSSTPPARMSMGMSETKKWLRNEELIAFKKLKPHEVSDFPLVKMRALFNDWRSRRSNTG